MGFSSATLLANEKKQLKSTKIVSCFIFGAQSFLIYFQSEH